MAPCEMQYKYDLSALYWKNDIGKQLNDKETLTYCPNEEKNKNKKRATQKLSHGNDDDEKEKKNDITTYLTLFFNVQKY